MDGSLLSEIVRGQFRFEQDMKETVEQFDPYEL